MWIDVARNERGRLPCGRRRTEQWTIEKERRRTVGGQRETESEQGKQSGRGMWKSLVGGRESRGRGGSKGEGQSER